MKNTKALLPLLIVFTAALTLYSQSDEPFYSLEDLYNRLESGTEGAAQEFSEPASGPGTPVGRSVNEIMEQMPSVHDSAATADQVLEGNYFWSLDGSGWGQKLGTMANVGGQSVTPGTSAQTITQGYHDGTGSVAGDADLIAENVRTGVTVFGVEGAAPVPSGDATAENVLAGSTFSNDTQTGVVGTMANVGGQSVTPGTSAQTITQGYHDGTGEVAGETNLTADNIRAGVSIFGVPGKSTVVDTETEAGSAATGADLLVGKSAWVNGEEITGTVPYWIRGQWVVKDNILIDPDDNIYTTVQIGNQIWTVENLRTTRYANGEPIPHVTANNEWIDRTTPGYCFNGNTTDPDTIARYGALYNWWVVDPLNENPIAPEGWRVPSDEDWTALTDHLGGADVAGAKMKTVEGWDEGNVSTNESGFSALPAGFRVVEFIEPGAVALFWSTTESSESIAYDRYTDVNLDALLRLQSYKWHGSSLRLVRDVE